MFRKSLRLFGITMLLVAAPVLAQDTDTVDISDGGEIALGSVAPGEFEVGARVRYTLEIEEGAPDTINIFLDSADENLDTYLRVYAEDGEEPTAENDDRGDGSLFSAITDYAVSAGDTLIIEAGTYADEGEGEYELRVTEPPNVTGAGEIMLGDSLEGELAVNSRQRYTLQVEDDSVLSILLEGSGALDSYLRLYPAGEAVPAIQNDDIEPENPDSGFATLVVSGGTTLVVEVAASGDTGAGSYTLTIEEADVDLEPAAEPIALGESTAAELCDGADEIAEPTRLQYLAPERVVRRSVDYGAVFCTAAGDFLVDLYEDEAPITVNSFVYLAENHFFDNTTFHRVIEDYVVQGGDPTGTGFGGPGYEFVNETDNELSFGGIGVLGMANAGPDTNGSQFFVTLAPVERLDGGYTIFGQVMQGMGSVFDVAIRDPQPDAEPGTTLETVLIITLPDSEAE